MKQETIDRIRKFSEDRDWDQFHSPANLAKSIVIEAAELLECFQWSDEDYNIEDVKEELADVMNYCIQLASKLNLDIKEIVENNKLQAIISMPSGVFQPYAGVSTAVMIFTKTTTGGTDKVWFYDMTADGFSLDAKRTKVAENDIPDIIERYNNLDKEVDRARTDKSFFVTKEEIASNDYDLSINKYKEIVQEKIEYENPKVILKQIIDMEEEFQKQLKELEELL